MATNAVNELPAPEHVRAIAPYQAGKPIEELAREFGKARRLRGHGAEDGQSFRAQQFFPVGVAEGHERGAYVLIAVERHQHRFDDLADHLGEQAILAAEVVVDRLPCNLRARRDTVDADPVAFLAEGLAGRVEQALAGIRSGGGERLHGTDAKK